MTMERQAILKMYLPFKNGVVSWTRLFSGVYDFIYSEEKG